MPKAARVLVLDGDAAARDAVAATLRGEAVEVATAADGAAGMACLRVFRPDLVVVDPDTPGCGGSVVLERIREADPSIVVIATGRGATVGSAVEAMRRGAFDVLPKPFVPEALRLALQRGAEERAREAVALARRRERELLGAQFGAVVTHELRAPLAALRQNLAVLERELAAVASEGQRARLGRVQVRADELLALIDTWRGAAVDLASLEARFAVVPVRVPIDRALETLAAVAARKAVEIAAVVPEPPPVVWGDAGTLTEVLVNIVGNAVKYSREGGRVVVTAAADAHEVRLTVADAGPGILPEELGSLFDAFSTLRPGAAGEPGSGLGLPISRRIVAAHGGSIRVDSTPGTGSTFVITLPAHRRDVPPVTDGTAAAGGARVKKDPR